MAERRAPYIDVELLTPNEYSRPQIPIESVQYIAIHYTANPGATAIANRNYFENLATTHDTKVSSHFVVGLDGEVVQCIPTSEMSYATNSRNVDTLSIECCHPDETGKFNEATYDSAVKLSAWLCVRFGLTSENVIRHYDVTGKNCPKYYVENPDAWIQMNRILRRRLMLIMVCRMFSKTVTVYTLLSRDIQAGIPLLQVIWNEFWTHYCERSEQ